MFRFQRVRNHENDENAVEAPLSTFPPLQEAPALLSDTFPLFPTPLCFQILYHLFPPPFAFRYSDSTTSSHLAFSYFARAHQTPAAWPGATSLARLPTFLPQTANDSHQLLQRISETTPSFSSVFATAKKAAGDACVFPKCWTLFSAEGALRSDRSFHYQNWHLPHSCSLYHFISEHSHHLLHIFNKICPSSCDTLFLSGF